MARKKGLFNDTRAYRHLFSILLEADFQPKIVDLVGLDFVVESVAAGYPKSAIIDNLATAIRSAAHTENWPAVIRYVELSRSVETFHHERLESLIVKYIDVVASLVGEDSLAENLLCDGHPTMDAESGLHMCEALDKLGAVPPWQEYIRAYIHQLEDDLLIYGDASASPRTTDWLRGRLRLTQIQSRSTSDSSLFSGRADNSDSELFSPLDLKFLKQQIDDNILSPRSVVEAILDTLGDQALAEFIDKLNHPGLTCLEFAKAIASKKASISAGSASYWAKRAAKCDLPPGHASYLMALGVNVDQVNSQPSEVARENLFDLTQRVQDYSALEENGILGEWMDACSVAATNDPLGLATAESLLEDRIWHTCWLKFTLSLVSAEVASSIKQPQLGLAALRILVAGQEPLPATLRRTLLIPFGLVVNDTVKRALDLLDDQTWEEGISLLFSMCDANFTGLGNLLGRGRLLDLIIETSTPKRGPEALAFFHNEIENEQGSDYYSEHAELRLMAARLALKINDRTEARRHWTDACRLLTAYGFRNDTTIFELLNPLHALLDVDPSRGRAAVAKIQPLCERVLKHTDGKGTSGTQSKWWQLLAEADPCALARLVQNKLLASCNDPNDLLHGARSDLWRTWHHRADPIVAGALRLTLKESLDGKDGQALRLLTYQCNETGTDLPSRLMIALLARADERPVEYNVTNSNELLNRDNKLVDKLNSIATHARLPGISSLPSTPTVARDSTASSHHPRLQVVPRLTRQDNEMFKPGAVGIAQAIRSWQNRQYDEPLQGRSLDRYANILGYRIIELVGMGRNRDAQKAVKSIASAGRLFEESTLVRSLAEGS